MPVIFGGPSSLNLRIGPEDELRQHQGNQRRNKAQQQGTSHVAAPGFASCPFQNAFPSYRFRSDYQSAPPLGSGKWRFTKPWVTLQQNVR